MSSFISPINFVPPPLSIPIVQDPDALKVYVPKITYLNLPEVVIDSQLGSAANSWINVPTLKVTIPSISISSPDLGVEASNFFIDSPPSSGEFPLVDSSDLIADDIGDAGIVAIPCNLTSVDLFSGLSEEVKTSINSLLSKLGTIDISTPSFPIEETSPWEGVSQTIPEDICHSLTELGVKNMIKNIVDTIASVSTDELSNALSEEVSSLISQFNFLKNKQLSLPEVPTFTFNDINQQVTFLESTLSSFVSTFRNTLENKSKELSSIVKQRLEEYLQDFKSFFSKLFDSYSSYYANHIANLSAYQKFSETELKPKMDYAQIYSALPNPPQVEWPEVSLSLGLPTKKTIVNKLPDIITNLNKLFESAEIPHFQEPVLLPEVRRVPLPTVPNVSFLLRPWPSIPAISPISLSLPTFDIPQEVYFPISKLSIPEIRFQDFSEFQAFTVVPETSIGNVVIPQIDIRGIDFEPISSTLATPVVIPNFSTNMDAASALRNIDFSGITSVAAALYSSLISKSYDFATFYETGLNRIVDFTKNFLRLQLPSSIAAPIFDELNFIKNSISKIETDLITAIDSFGAMISSHEEVSTNIIDSLSSVDSSSVFKLLDEEVDSITKEFVAAVEPILEFNFDFLLMAFGSFFDSIVSLSKFYIESIISSIESLENSLDVSVPPLIRDDFLNSVESSSDITYPDNSDVVLAIRGLIERTMTTVINNISSNKELDSDLAFVESYHPPEAISFFRKPLEPLYTGEKFKDSTDFLKAGIITNSLEFIPGHSNLKVEVEKYDFDASLQVAKRSAFISKSLLLETFNRELTAIVTEYKNKLRLLKVESIRSILETMPFLGNLSVSLSGLTSVDNLRRLFDYQLGFVKNKIQLLKTSLLNQISVLIYEYVNKLKVSLKASLKQTYSRLRSIVETEGAVLLKQLKTDSKLLIDTLRAEVLMALYRANYELELYKNDLKASMNIAESKLQALTLSPISPHLYSAYYKLRKALTITGAQVRSNIAAVMTSLAVDELILLATIDKHQSETIGAILSVRSQAEHLLAPFELDNLVFQQEILHELTELRSKIEAGVGTELLNSRVYLFKSLLHLTKSLQIFLSSERLRQQIQRYTVAAFVREAENKVTTRFILESLSEKLNALQARSNADRGLDSAIAMTETLGSYELYKIRNEILNSIFSLKTKLILQEFSNRNLWLQKQLDLSLAMASSMLEEEIFIQNKIDELRAKGTIYTDSFAYQAQRELALAAITSLAEMKVSSLSNHLNRNMAMQEFLKEYYEKVVSQLKSKTESIVALTTKLNEFRADMSKFRHIFFPKRLIDDFSLKFLPISLQGLWLNKDAELRRDRLNVELEKYEMLSWEDLTDFKNSLLELSLSGVAELLSARLDTVIKAITSRLTEISGSFKNKHEVAIIKAKESIKEAVSSLEHRYTTFINRVLQQGSKTKIGTDVTKDVVNKRLKATVDSLTHNLLLESDKVESHLRVRGSEADFRIRLRKLLLEDRLFYSVMLLNKQKDVASYQLALSVLVENYQAKSRMLQGIAEKNRTIVDAVNSLNSRLLALYNNFEQAKNEDRSRYLSYLSGQRSRMERFATSNRLRNSLLAYTSRLLSELYSLNVLNYERDRLKLQEAILNYRVSVGLKDRLGFIEERIKSILPVMVEILDSKNEQLGMERDAILNRIEAFRRRSEAVIAELESLINKQKMSQDVVNIQADSLTAKLEAMSIDSLYSLYFSALREYYSIIFSALEYYEMGIRAGTMNEALDKALDEELKREENFLRFYVLPVVDSIIIQEMYERRAGEIMAKARIVSSITEAYS